MVYFLHLENCRVCGRISVHKGYCLVCRNDLDKTLESRKITRVKENYTMEKIIRERRTNFLNDLKYSFPKKYRFENDISFDTGGNSVFAT